MYGDSSKDSYNDAWIAILTMRILTRIPRIARIMRTLKILLMER